MVVMIRGYSKNDRFILPLVKENKEQEPEKSLDQTEQLHQPFWSSGQRSHQVANYKKDDTLSSWGNPQEDDYYAGASAETKRQITITARGKKINVWTFLTFCLVVMGGTTYWHLKASLRLILEETESVMSACNEVNIKLRLAEKDVCMLSREVASTATLFEKQRERLGEESNVREHADSVKRLSEAQSSLDDMRGYVKSQLERKAALKDAVQRQSCKIVEAKYGKAKEYPSRVRRRSVETKNGKEKEYRSRVQT